MLCSECTKKLPAYAFFSRKDYAGVDYNSWYQRSPICKSCFAKKYMICKKCHRHFEKSMMQSNNMCKECFEKTSFCADCHKELEKYEVHKRGGVIRCADCDSKVYIKQGGMQNGVILTEAVNVYVFLQKNPCPNHLDSVGCVTAYAIGMEDAQMHPINVYYCSECQLYYINSTQYLSFAKKYGLPLIKIGFQRRNTYGAADFSEWNSQSFLNWLGYKVNANDNLSEGERQRILVDCIDAGLMTKAQICTFLENLLSLHEKNDKDYPACQKWEADLIYIRKYKMNEQRMINARFVMKKYL